MKQPYHFYATVLPGMETIAAAELHTLSAHEIRESQGSVHFSGTMDTLYRVSLRSRTLTRILLRVGKCQAMTYEALQQHIAEMNWQAWLSADMPIQVRASAEHSKLFHSQHIEEAVLAGVRDALGTSSDKGKNGVQQSIHIHIRNNRCDVRVDTSGDRLDRRGYRVQTVAAPIRETLAASLLQWMDWKVDEALYVPMCGSGTFAIEAAQIGQGIAANIDHAFPFLAWPSFKAKRWQRLLDKTQAMHQERTLQIVATDMNAKAVQATRNNVTHAHVSDVIQMDIQDVRDFAPKGDGGLVVCNPPYGMRLEHEDASFYSMLGKRLKALDGAWNILVICPSWKHERALGMSVRRKLKFRHGGLWLEALDVTPKRAN